jgi:DNA-binding response OmpR family regulator
METVDSSRVLVVDDEPQITRVLKTVLSSQGYQVRTAAEGESALTNFKEWSPELVITDLYMPHMDGVELCRRIREVSTVPIIVLSVKGEERSKVEALDSGADDYVTKPFGIDELMACVRRCVAAADQGVLRNWHRSTRATSASTWMPGVFTRTVEKYGSRRRSSTCSCTWRAIRIAC